MGVSVSGLLFHTCGAKFRGNPGRKGTFYYRCMGCNRSIKTDIIDNTVLKELFESGILAELNSVNKEFNKKEAEFKKLQREENFLKTKEKKLIDLYTDDLITREEYIERKNNINNNIEIIQSKILTLTNEKSSSKQALDFEKMFISVLSELKTVEDKKEANKLLKKIIKKIEVNDDKEVFVFLNL